MKKGINIRLIFAILIFAAALSASLSVIFLKACAKEDYTIDLGSEITVYAGQTARLNPVLYHGENIEKAEFEFVEYGGNYLDLNGKTGEFTVKGGTTRRNVTVRVKDTANRAQAEVTIKVIDELKEIISLDDLADGKVVYGGNLIFEVNPLPKTTTLQEYMAAAPDCNIEAVVSDSEGVVEGFIVGITVEGNEIKLTTNGIGSGTVKIKITNDRGVLYGERFDEQFDFTAAMNNKLINAALLSGSANKGKVLMTLKDISSVTRVTLTPEGDSLDLSELNQFATVKEIIIDSESLVTVSNAPANADYFVPESLVNDYIISDEWLNKTERIYPSETPDEGKVWVVTHSEFSDSVACEQVPSGGLPQNLSDDDEYGFAGWAVSSEMDNKLASVSDKCHVYAQWTPKVDNPSSPYRWFKFTEKDGAAFVSGFSAAWQNYTGGFDKTAVNFPALSDTGLPVIGVSAQAFEGNAEIKSVLIKKNIIEIGERAFADCSALERAEFGGIRGDSGLDISDGAFCGCKSLTEVFGGGNIRSVGEDAFLFAPWYTDAATANNGFKMLGKVLVKYLPESEGNITLDLYTFAQGATVIAPKAFENYGSGSSAQLLLELPSYLERVERRAFKGAAFTAIVASGADTVYDETAFDGCAMLEDAEISTAIIAALPKSALKTLTITGAGELAAKAFSNAAKLESVSISPRITSITGDAFRSCAELADIVIADATETSVYYSANNCVIRRSDKKLIIGCKNSTIPRDGRVESIGEYAFADCVNLLNLAIPDTVKSLGYGAFEGCVNIETASLPSLAVGFIPKNSLKQVTVTSGTKIEEHAFDGASALEKATLSDSVTLIEAYAFYNAEKLSEIDLGAGIDEIKEFAFAGCKTLANLTGGAAVTEIGERAFRDTAWLEGAEEGEFLTLGIVLVRYKVTADGVLDKPFPAGITKIGRYAFEEGLQTNRIKELVIPEGITVVREHAFENCTELEKLSIPNSVQTIASNAFEDSRSLKEIILPTHAIAAVSGRTAALKKLTIRGGKIIPANAFSTSEALETLIIESGVEEIGANAFMSCVSLSTLSIPASAATIAENAFADCNKIAYVTIPAQAIGKIAISSLIELTVNGGTEIPQGAFAGASKLVKVTVSNTVTAIGAKAFSGCSSLAEMTLPFTGRAASVTSGSDSLFGYVFGSDEYEGGVKTAQKYRTGVFPYFYNTIYYYIPASLKTVTITGGSLNYGAFSGCENLVKINLPKGITEIPDYAFESCKSLQSFDLAGVKSIGTYAFFECETLREANLDVAENIGDHAFDYCSGIKTLSLNKGTVGSSAFANTKITEADISAEVTSVAGSAFENSTAVIFVRHPSKPAEWSNSWNASNCVAVWNYAGVRGSTSDGVLWAELNDCNAVVYGYAGDGGKLVIPEEIARTEAVISDGSPRNMRQILKIGEIADYAFRNAESLTEITVPQGINRIGNAAFKGCTGLTKITLPFVGERADAVAATSQTLFGYVFGDESYTGGVPADQNYDDDNGITYHIPSKLAEAVITGGRLFYGAFCDCTTLKSVVLPADIKDIPASAFNGCSSLVGLAIPETVAAIGANAFAGCASLTAITMPYAFEGTLGSLFGENYYEGAYAADQGGTTYYFPEGLTRIILNGGNDIPAYAFGGMVKLSQITLPYGLKTIGAHAFKNCPFETVFIPDSVTAVGESAFNISQSGVAFVQCGFKAEWNGWYEGTGAIVWNYGGANGVTSEGLKWALLNDGTMSIFGYEGKQPDLIIPESYDGKRVTVISENAFYGLNSVEIADIPKSVEVIYSHSFGGDSCIIFAAAASKPEGWNSAWNPDDCEVIWNYAGERTNTDGFKWAKLNDDTAAIYGYIGESADGAFDISAVGGLSVSRIMRESFQGLKGASAIIIGERVSFVGANAFKNCVGATIFLKGDDEGFNAQWNPDPCPVIKNYGGQTGSNGDFEWVLHNDNTVGILKYTGNDYIVTVPETIEGNPVKIIYGGEFGAFSGNTNMVSVSLPSSLEEIHGGAFGGCLRLAEVINKSQLVLEKGSAESNGSVAERALIIHDGETKTRIQGDYIFVETEAGLYLVAYAGGDTVLSLPENYNGSGYGVRENAFCTSAQVTDISVPQTVTLIEGGAFAGVTSLVNIALPFVGERKTLTAASERTYFGYIFGYKDNLPETVSDNAPFAVPETLRSISVLGGIMHESAFSRLEKVTKIVLPENLNEISPKLFYSCYDLTEITIPDRVQKIGENAFFCCFDLESINIPSSTKTLEQFAFMGCNKLSEVHITHFESWLGTQFGNAEANPLCYAHNLYIYDKLLTGINLSAAGNATMTWLSSSGMQRSSTGLEKINDYVFVNATCLEVVQICDNLPIGSHTFRGCAFKKAALPANLVSKVIGDGRQNLTEIMLVGEENLSLGANALQGAEKLTTVTFNVPVASIGAAAFEGCTALTGVYLKSVSLDAWSGTSFSNAKSNPLYYAHNLYLNTTLVTKVSFTGDIKDYAFVNATCITEVKGGTNNSVGAHAFDGCTKIKNLETGASYISIILGDRNKNLETLTITSAGELPENALSGAVKLKSVNLGSVTRIGANAFKGCAALSGFTSGDKVEFIGSGALDDTAWYNSSASILCLGKVIVKYRSANKIDLTGASSYENINSVNPVTAVYDAAFAGAKIGNLNVLSSITYGAGAFRGATVDTLTLPSLNAAAGSNCELGYLFGGSGNIGTIQFDASATGATLALNGAGITADSVIASKRNLSNASVSGFSKIGTLDLSGNALTNPALNSVEITYLQLYNNAISTLNLTNIRAWRIALNGNSVSKLTCDEPNEYISVIYMPADGSQNALTSLEFTKNLPNLRSLDVANNNVSKLDGLETLTNLTELYLGGNPILNDATQMTKLNTATFFPKLTRLNLGDSTQTDLVLKMVKKSVNLKWLQIYNIGATSAQITNAITRSTHANLSYLKISHNGFTATPASLNYIKTVVVGYEDYRQD